MSGARRLRIKNAHALIALAFGVALIAAVADADPAEATIADRLATSANSVGAEAAEPDRALIRPEEGEIWRLYLAALGRRAEPGGFEYWVARRVEGVSLAVIAESFLASREFHVRFGAASDAEFLELVYHHVLGRDGDDAGTSYWREVLAGGFPRSDVVILFAESVEHRRVTGTELPTLPAFRPAVRSVSADELGSSWRPGCPVGPDDLRSIELDHVDLTGSHKRGTLIVHRAVADDLVRVFAELYSARFPIEMMVPVARFDGDDNASMDAGNTSAFNCRAVTGGTRWSRHAYGRAVDINPRQNPYASGSLVLPPSGADYLDRDRFDPAMIRPGDVVTRSFDAIGWRWGGNFSSVVDYQHFDR
ncbi:MAG: DUF4214 domain-containing protein [Acidimicrobiales bacterium]